MIIQTKFNIGQHVCSVSTRREQNYVPCKYCEGLGKIGLKGDIFTCPKCYGRKGDIVYTGKEEFYISHEDATIGQVEVAVFNQFPESKVTSSRIVYMLYETGVGSGTLWPENDLFSTKEEALDYCKERNILEGLKEGT